MCQKCFGPTRRCTLPAHPDDRDVLYRCDQSTLCVCSIRPVSDNSSHRKVTAERSARILKKTAERASIKQARIHYIGDAATQRQARHPTAQSSHIHIPSSRFADACTASQQTSQRTQACKVDGIRELLVGKAEGQRPLRRPSTDAIIILKWDGLIWLRMETSCGLM